MARKKRQWYPGATYHVMSRGNRRNAIFKEKYDYVTFLEYRTGTRPFPVQAAQCVPDDKPFSHAD